MAVADRVRRVRAVFAQALRDLFDQASPVGRLSLVQVLMLSGDTLVTISLAGSLFFSISPTEAKSKVFFYLLLTLAPFAIVSPLLGPLIDRSRNARRAMVVVSAVARAVLCPFMARDVHSILLFPEAFLILVFSKLYLVTRGALVPEMVAADQAAQAAPPPPGTPPGTRHRRAPTQFAVLNARLTLLGTLAGFVVSIPGVLLLRLWGAPAVLWFGACVFAGAAVAGIRLPVLRWARDAAMPGGPAPGPAAAGTGGRAAPLRTDAWGEHDPDLARLAPIAHPEVLLGLTTMSMIRGLAGFLIFLLAFGLRHLHAPLWWYGLALGASGIGALVGLVMVPRARERLHEQQILLVAIWTIALVALGMSFWRVLFAQVVLAFAVGVAGSLAQPSFDAMAQRFVPLPEQGRAFARFATRQQLTWVVGAMIPVLVQFPLPAGDVVMAAVAGAGGLFYVTSRRALRGRAIVRHQRDLG